MQVDAALGRQQVAHKLQRGLKWAMQHVGGDGLEVGVAQGAEVERLVRNQRSASVGRRVLLVAVSGYGARPEKLLVLEGEGKRLVQGHLGTLGVQALVQLVAQSGPDAGDHPVVLGEVAGVAPGAEDPQRVVRSADQDGSALGGPRPCSGPASSEIVQAAIIRLPSDQQIRSASRVSRPASW